MSTAALAKTAAAATAKAAAPPRHLFLFRHMITGKVVVSSRFLLEDADLAQIGEHRPQNRLRRDHWVPFAVVAGAPPRAIELLCDVLAVRVKDPRGRQRLPIPRRAVEERTRADFAEAVARGESESTAAAATATSGWTVPAPVAESVAALCEALRRRRVARALGRDAAVRVLWERSEFRDAAAGARELWPAYVAHARLRLLRNRFPVVDGEAVRG